VNLKPAEYVIHVLGGVRPTARALGYSPSAVSRWRKAGRGELSTKARKIVLAYAKKNRLPITADDLQYGAKVRRLSCK